jgi:hypothetical protein
MTKEQPIIEARSAQFAVMDTIEVRPCCIVDCTDGIETVQMCAPTDASFWSVYGRCVTGGLDCSEDFPTEAEAEAFAKKLLRHYNPHLFRMVRYWDPPHAPPASFKRPTKTRH